MPAPTPKQRHFAESRIGGGQTFVDGTTAFYVKLRSMLRPDMVVLDVGCGRDSGRHPEPGFKRDLMTLKGSVRQVIGLDVDPAAKSNTALDEFRLLEGSTWPVAGRSVDFVLASCVLEHVDDPDAFFGEAARVLRPGGYIMLMTPNIRSYFGLASWIIPDRFHKRIVGSLQPERPEEDVFPTLYRCNTPRKLRRALARHGFDAAVIGFEAEPTYFDSSRILYSLGVWHAKLAPRGLKVSMFAVGQRRDDQPNVTTERHA